MESNWDRYADQLYHFDLDDNGNVALNAPEFVRRGAIDSWLSSPIFELKQPGSSQREAAIHRALTIQESMSPTAGEIEIATVELAAHLAPEDPFWVRWIFFARTRGVNV